MSNTNFDFDNVSNNLNAMCRSCLATDRKFIDIYSKLKTTNKNCETEMYIYEMIADCAQILIKKDDELPQQLCKICADQTAEAFSFRYQTRQSDALLRKFISIKKSIDSSIVNDDSVFDDSSTIHKDENNSWNELDKSSIRLNLEIIESEKKSVLNKKKIKKKVINKKHKMLGITRKSKKSEDILTENIINEQLDDLMNEVQSEFDVTSATTVLDNCVGKDSESVSDTKLSCFDVEDIKKNMEDSFNNENLNNSPRLETDDEDSSTELTLADVKAKNNKRVTNKKPTYPPLYSEPDAPQTCSVCDTIFSNVSSLIKHRAQSHGPKKYQCLTCGNGLTTTRGLRIHMRLHTGEKPEICVVCGKTFSDPRTLKSHERIHTGQQPFPCTICNKRFPARLSLALHLRSHTGERPYQCQHCDKSYVLSNSFKIHMRTHTGVKPYACKLCDKGFTNKTSLSVHMLTHSGVKNFQCTVCGKRMARSGELTVHLRTHSGERPFACTICQKTFTNSSALRDHATTHTGVKNYVCTVCGKRMARAMELNVHMRTHTGEKRYRCPHCDQKFTTSSNMRLHLRKHTGEKPFACDVCNRKFADSHALKNHIRTHTGEKPYACDTCGNTFTQLGSLNTHLNTHHKVSVAQKPVKKPWNYSKEAQIINLGTKSNQHYLTSLDDSSLSKILSSSGGIDQSNIDLQECVPIGMHTDTVVQLNSGHQNFATSIESDSQLLQIIKRPMDVQTSLPNMDVWQNCLTITSPQTFKLV